MISAFLAGHIRLGLCARGFGCRSRSCAPPKGREDRSRADSIPLNCGCRAYDECQTAGASPGLGKTDVRYSANTIEEMQKLLLGYRDNMRVEVETGVAITAKTVADLRALSTWPNGLLLSIHVDLDPRLSVVTVERAS